jgi:hypothetical protein
VRQGDAGGECDGVRQCSVLGGVAAVHHAVQHDDAAAHRNELSECVSAAAACSNT